jgi:hypothetical protein
MTYAICSGFTAQFCTYVVADIETDEIIAFYVAEKGQVR